MTEVAGYWIPACAGMTREVRAARVREALADWGAREYRIHSSMVWLQRLSQPRLSSRLGAQRQDRDPVAFKAEGMGKAVEAAGYWIPAFAGMTREVRAVRVREVLADWSARGYRIHSSMVRLQRHSQPRLSSRFGAKRQDRDPVAFRADGMGKAVQAVGYWIPACAGMTRRLGQGRPAQRKSMWMALTTPRRPVQLNRDPVPVFPGRRVRR